MDSREKSRHCAVLEKEDTDSLSRTWKTSAEFFRNAARSGEDIEDVIDLLADVFRQCSQVPTMEVLAEAIVLHCLQRSSAARLASIVSSVHYPLYFLRAVEDSAEQGADLLPHLSWLLQYPEEDMTVARVLRKYIQHGPPNRLAELFQSLTAIPQGRELLPRLIQEAGSNGVNVTAGLPVIANLLRQPQRRLLVSALLWTLPADLSLIIEPLHECLNDPEETTRRNAACCIAYQIAGLEPSPETVTDALRDPSHDVREAAFLLLRRLCTQKSFELTDGLVTALGEASLNPALKESIREFLWEAIRSRPRESARIRAALSGFPILPELHDANPVCSICASIPRSQEYSYEGEVPPAFEKLELVSSEEHSLPAEMRRCPECGSFYEYSFEAETEDMSHYVSIQLRRVAPAEMLSRARGSLLVRVQNSYPSLIENAKQNLDHPVRRERAEAAWALASHAIDHGEFDLLAALCANEDKIIRSEAIHEASAACDAGRESRPIGVLLAARLDDSAEEIGAVAARGLARLMIGQGDTEGLLDLLHRRPAVIASAAQQVWLALAASTLKAEPLIGRLTELIAHPLELARRYATLALKAAGFPGPGPEAGSLVTGRLEAFFSALSHSDARIRCDAADALRGALELNLNIDPAVPRLIELLVDQESAWHANRTLGALAGKGTSIAGAFPAIARQLTVRPEMREEFLETLRSAQNSGADLVSILPFLGPLLKDKKTGYSALYLIQKYPPSALIAIENDLREGMYGKNFEALHEQCCHLYTRVLVVQGRMEEVAEILRDPKRQIRSACVSILGTLCKEGYAGRLGQIASGIADNLRVESPFLQGGTASLLKRIAAESPEARSTVLSALAQVRHTAAVILLAELSSP